MKVVLETKESNCRNCYKCIRQCPVKSIGFTQDQAYILSEDCIYCGDCYVVCPQDAKEILSEVEKVREAIRNGRRVYASVAPSFLAAFPVASLSPLKNMLQGLGFHQVEETAIGAEIVKREYEKLIASKYQNVLISTCCSSVNALVERYFPEAVPYLAPVLSPMQAHCKSIKEKDPEAYTVFIGPCISKKKEAQDSLYTDVALTFYELYDWMEKSNVLIEEDQTPGDIGKRTRFFPTVGGILRSMDQETGVVYLCIDGIENCISVLQELSSEVSNRVFIEMSACFGSCINGPCAGLKKNKLVEANMKIHQYAGDDDFMSPSEREVGTEYISRKPPRVNISEALITDVLAKMGKQTEEDELNCGSCGYSSCRDKAIAVIRGKANLSMCLPYLKEKAESFSENIIQNTPSIIIVMDKNLMVQQVNKAALEFFHIHEERYILNEPISKILHPLDYIKVTESRASVYDKKDYLADYQRYVKQTILYDASYQLVIVLMKDITEEELAEQEKIKLKKDTVDIADHVINKQLRVVQEIASLLGETAAETKIALTNLKNAVDK